MQLLCSFVFFAIPAHAAAAMSELRAQTLQLTVENHSRSATNAELRARIALLEAEVGQLKRAREGPPVRAQEIVQRSSPETQSAIADAIMGLDPEDTETKQEVEQVEEAAGGVMNVEIYTGRYFYNQYVAHIDQESCTGFFLQWDPSNQVTKNGRCTLTTAAMLIAVSTLVLVEFAIWWLVCKGKSRSVRTMDDTQLQQYPYQAIGICDCWGLKARAVIEAIFCPTYMWGETMVRSGTMPWPVVALVSIIQFVVSKFTSSLGMVFCLLRCLGRVSLRNKIDHKAPNSCTSLISDCAVICCCPCCSIAQETEYLELKANKGQPASDDADLQQMLSTNAPKEV
jgi:Cys-rich protein (TIGR01571 family)